jgi:hypothetical protein
MSIDVYPPPGLARAGSVLAFVPVEFSQAITAPTAMPGFTATVYVPPGRTLRISGRCYANNNTVGARTAMYINRDGDQKNAGFLHHPTAGVNSTLEAEFIDQPTPGVHVYTLSAAPNSGTSTLAGDNNDYQAYLLVEDITGGTGGPGPISLGYAEVVANQSVPATADTALTGLSVSVSVPAGRRIRVTGHTIFQQLTAAGSVRLKLYEAGAELQRLGHFDPAAVNQVGVLEGAAVLRPTAGTHTYYLMLATSAGSVNSVASATFPAFIHVEDITGTEAPTGAYYEALWTPVTAFLNGWLNYGGTYTPAAYRKVNDLVYLRGLIKSGTLSTPAFNLPVGYRPAWDHHFTGLSNSALAGIRVFQDGRVTPGDPGNNVWIALDGIVFGVT